MRHLVALAVLSQFAIAQTNAQNPVSDELTKAKEAYQKEIEKAKASFIFGFEFAEKAIQNRSSLSGEQKVSQIQTLRGEKETFLESGMAPASIGMKTYITEYQVALSRSERAMIKAFDTELDAVAKKKDFNRGAALLTEKKALVKEIDERRNRLEFGALLGKWSVEVIGSNFRSVWTFTPDNCLTSSEGAKNGKWKFDKDKRRIVITWDEVKNAWETLKFPVDPKGTLGETWLNPSYRVKAVKIK